MLGVEVTNGQIRNFMIFSESSKSSHSLVEILLLHKIIRYSRRISHTRKMTTVWTDDAEGVELDVAEKMP
jgi:hypothetical protein